MKLASERGMPPPVVSQVIYNLLIREIEVEHLAFARRYGVHVTVYNALAGGLLTGAYTAARDDAIRKGSRFDKNSMYLRRYWSQRMFELVDALRPIADAAGMSLVDLAYAWVASRPGVDSVLVGPVTLDHLEHAVAAVSGAVSEDVAARIDTAYRAWLGTDTHYVR